MAHSMLPVRRAPAVLLVAACLAFGFAGCARGGDAGEQAVRVADRGAGGADGIPGDDAPAGGVGHDDHHRHQS